MKKEHKRKLNLGDIIRKMSEDDPGTVSHSDVRPPRQETDLSNTLHRKEDPLRTVEQPPLPSQPKINTTPSPSIERHERKEPLQEIHGDAHGSTLSPIPDDEKIPSRAQPMPPIITTERQPDNEESEEEFDFFRYIGVIIRRKEIIILATLVMGLFSTFSYLKSTRYYTAHARLLFRPNQETIIENRPYWQVGPERDRNFNTHLELLQSNPRRRNEHYRIGVQIY